MNTLTTILTVFLCNLFMSHPQKDIETTVLMSEVSYKEGIYYFKNRVFTGSIIDYYEDEKLKFRYGVLEGRLHGEAFQYFSNGRVKSKRHYVSNKLFGAFEEHYESGELRASFTVKLNAYNAGEQIEDITVGTFKKGRYKKRKYENGILYFMNQKGETFESSELISILNQTKYKITDGEGKKVLLPAD